MALLMLTRFGLAVLADVTSAAGVDGVVLNAGATTSWLPCC